MAVHLGQGVYYALPALSPTPTQEEPQKVVRHPCLGLGWVRVDERRCRYNNLSSNSRVSLHVSDP